MSPTSEPCRLTKAQRAAAVERTAENLALLSGAGCGKTLVLARRFTELLLASQGRENPLLRFVALTFTEKAAREMQDRLRRFLTDRAAQSKGPDRSKLLTWLSELPEARIGTIHSFCAALLRTHAIAAGVDPDFTVCAEELLTEELMTQAAEQAVLEALEAAARDAIEAVNELTYDRLLRCVIRLLESRTAWQAEDYSDPQHILDRWQRQLQTDRKTAWQELCEDRAFLEELEHLQAAVCSDDEDKLAVHRDKQFSLLRQLLRDPQNGTPELFAGLQSKPGNIGSAGNWGGKQQLIEVRAGINALVDKAAQLAEYTEPFNEQDEKAAQVLCALLRLAGRAEELYAVEKRRRGLLDFTDLLTGASRLLSENPALREAIGSQIDQLLLDEAQDTDAFQLALLETLLFGRPGRTSPPDGKLFVVGDAKQSIYRFRGAQVETFEDLCRRLGPNRRESLSHSFRTHAAGVAFLNHLFAPMMGKDYQAIQAHRQDCPVEPSVEILLAESADATAIDSTAQARAAQAGVLAQRIAEMVRRKEPRVWDAASSTWRPVEYRDIAVLFARMTISAEFERQLALQLVPYHVVGGTDFYKQQEIYDLLNALQVIDNPFDDVAFLGVLRSSLFGLDDHALMHLAETNGPPYLPNLWEQISAGQTPSETLSFAVRLLRKLHQAKDAIGTAEVLQQLIEQTGYEAALLCRFQGRRGVGNVRLLLQQARSAAAEGLSLAEFVRQIGRKTLAESRQEQAGTAGEAENFVQLMTIHKAKGLEFPVVFLPDLNYAPQGTAKGMLNRSDWGVTLKLDSPDEDEANSSSLAYRLAKRRERADEHAEDIRTFYVAATRHRDHLVFVAANWRDKQGRFRSSHSTLAEMDRHLGLREVLDQHSEQLLYDEGRYAAIVRKVRPTISPVRKQKPPPGQAMLAKAKNADELVEALGRSTTKKSDELSALGPLRPETGRVELAVTALNDFAYCPMLYRWQVELRVPRRFATTRHGQAPAADAPDAATLGTLYHRCMELLDFTNPQPAEVLICRAMDEMSVPVTADAKALTSEFRPMQERFCRHELAGQLAKARQCFRELNFAARIGPAVLHGQIDLLFQDAEGSWHIVDYKSDRLEVKDIASHAQRYELQMLVYAAAAARHLGTCCTDAMLYFLRPASTHCFPICNDTIRQVEQRIAGLANQLRNARRTGFQASRSHYCAQCPYDALCQSLILPSA